MSDDVPGQYALEKEFGRLEGALLAAEKEVKDLRAEVAQLWDLVHLVTPRPGDIWHFPPIVSADTTDEVRVACVQWVDGAVWVSGVPLAGGDEVQHELSQWVTSAVLLQDGRDA